MRWRLSLVVGEAVAFEIWGKMSRPMKYGLAAIALVVALLYFGLATVMWDGGFPRAEYRLKIVDPSGAPVPGLSMKVFTEDGDPAPRYPVVQFDGSTSLVPGADGVFTFHQIQSGLQFGGRYTELFGMRVWGNSSPPQYVCRFYVDSRLVHSEPFSDLCDRTMLAGAETVRKKFLVREIHRPDQLAEFAPEQLDSVALEDDFPVVEQTVTLKGS